MSPEQEESCNNRRDKLLFEAITTRLEKLMNDKLQSFRDELVSNKSSRKHQYPEQVKSSKLREPRRQQRYEVSHDYYHTYSPSSQRKQMLHKDILVEQQVKRRGTSRTSYGSVSNRLGYQKEEEHYAELKEILHNVLIEQKTKMQEIESVLKPESEAPPHVVNTVFEEEVSEEQIEQNVEYKVLKGKEESENVLLLEKTLFEVDNEDIQPENDLPFQKTFLEPTNEESESKVESEPKNVSPLEEYEEKVQGQLQWFNSEGEMRVNHQVIVPFSIGKYEDEVLYGVLPMEANHILLGRPWPPDKMMIHEYFPNWSTLVFRDIKTILIPKLHLQGYDDQSYFQHEETRLITQPNLFMKANEVKKSMSFTQPIFLFVIKETLMRLTNPKPVPPSETYSFLQEIKEVFPNDIPKKLLPIICIKHQTHFQWQMSELMEKGHSRESMSLYVVPVLLVPKEGIGFKTVLFQEKEVVANHEATRTETVSVLSSFLNMFEFEIDATGIGIGGVLVFDKKADSKREATGIGTDLMIPYFPNMFEILRYATGVGIEANVIQEMKLTAYFSRIMRSFHELAEFYKCFIKDFKARRKKLFEAANKAWKYFRKKIFSAEKQSKILSRIDGPFNIIMRIINDAYQLDLQGKYNVSSSFNVSDLVPFIADEADLRSNLFEEGGDDMIMESTEDITKDAAKGPMTRSRTKLFNQAIGGILKHLNVEKEEDIQTTLVLIQAHQ